MAMAWKRDATYLLAFCYQRNGLAEAKYYEEENTHDSESQRG